MHEPVDAMSLLATDFERYRPRLLHYLTGHVRPEAWGRVEDLAQEVWLYALEAGDVTDSAPDATGLPAYLARIARAVARREASPATADEIEVCVGFRGHEAILAAVAPPPPPRTPAETAEQYAVAHGSPDRWEAREIEVYLDLATWDANDSLATVTALPRAEDVVLSPAA